MMSAGMMPGSLYAEIYGKWIPRVCVDLIFLGYAGVLLKRRVIAPVGIWHLPGGAIRKGETLLDAAQRHALDELGITVKSVQVVGVVQDLQAHMEVDDVPLDMHNIMIQVIAETDDAIIETSNLRWWKGIPHAAVDLPQMRFLVDKHYLRPHT